MLSSTVSKHYEGNRSKNQVVRSDLHQAKSLQEYEYAEMMRRYQEELDKQLDNDARIAAQIQEQEINVRDSSKSGLQRQESVVERDRLVAERLQAKERMKVLKYKLMKEKRQVERVASGSGMSNSQGTNSPGLCDNNSNHSNDSGNALRRVRGNDIIDISDLTEFCIKPPDDLTEEEKRIFLEEQDAELARFLQKQEAARNMAKDSTKMTIETHDAEIARILQDQEKAKARKLREKARLRALQRQQLQDNQTSSNHGHDGTHSTHSNSNHHRHVHSSNPLQVHPSSTHNVGPSVAAAAHSPSITGSSFAHSPSMSINHSFHDGSPSPASSYSHSRHHPQQQQHYPGHTTVPSQLSNPSQSHCQGINPLRHNSGSNSPHFNNNQSSNSCLQGPVTSSSHQHHCHPSPSPGQSTFDTQEEEEEEECYDDDNPIIDRYYPVGDDLKRMMNQRKNTHQPCPDGHFRPNGRVASIEEESNNGNFHNIAMDLDPTYNRSAASKSPSNGHHGGNHVDHAGDGGGQTETDINGLHFAKFCRVSPTLAKETNGSRIRTKSPEINPAILPVPGHRRQEKSKKNRKMADGCKQQ